MLKLLHFIFLQLYLCYVLVLCRAFVAPADIQAFTSEAKNKLSARLQGKTKYFAQAVKEISAAFDVMQKQKASGLADDTDDSHIGSEAPSNVWVPCGIVIMFGIELLHYFTLDRQKC